MTQPAAFMSLHVPGLLPWIFDTHRSLETTLDFPKRCSSNDDYEYWYDGGKMAHHWNLDVILRHFFSHVIFLLVNSARSSQHAGCWADVLSWAHLEKQHQHVSVTGWFSSTARGQNLVNWRFQTRRGLSHVSPCGTTGEESRVDPLDGFFVGQKGASVNVEERVVKIEFCRLMKCISDASMARASPGLSGAGTVDSIEGSLPRDVVFDVSPIFSRWIMEYMICIQYIYMEYMICIQYIMYIQYSYDSYNMY